MIFHSSDQLAINSAKKKKKIICVNTKIYIFFTLIKFDEWIDMTDSFNKHVISRLRNLDLFNKCVRLVLIHVVEYLKLYKST